MAKSKNTKRSVSKSKTNSKPVKKRVIKSRAINKSKPASNRTASKLKPNLPGSLGGRAVPGKLEKPTKNNKPVELMPPVPGAERSMTSGKPKKNQAGMLTKDLEHFRQLLLGKRHELLGDMSSMEREALRSTTGSNLSNLPVHMADMGTDNYEQEFTLGLVEKDRVLLREINVALAKIQDGSYGICEGTGKPISKARLEAQPWARYSIEYARKLEMGLIRPMI